MNHETAAKEIKKLTDIINYHNKLYYQENRSEISDYEFDQLLAQLEQLEQTFPDLKQPNSPTEKVGSNAEKTSNKVTHPHPMLSLSNTYAADEVEQFIQRVRKNLIALPVAFFCELKFDGVAVSLHYQDGKLAKAVTRGNGSVGDDITNNIQEVPNIPHEIKGQDIPAFFEVRGEIVLPLLAFKKLNEKRLAEGLELLANPRNTAAGAIKTIKKHAGLRDLSFFAYSVSIDSLPISTQEASITWLTSIGFSTSSHTKKCTSLADVMTYINYWQTAKQQLPVAIDGIVIKVNDLKQQHLLGNTTKNPRWAIAYKYKPENISTILLNVDFHVGRTGVITPVANLQPVLLAGTVVKRATLYNAMEIERLGLHQDDTIFLEKGGEIIPKITGVDLQKRKPNSLPITFPTNCPACETPLVQKYAKALLYCPNTDTCPYQLRELLKHFVSKKAMDFQSMGKKTIDLLIRHNLIRNLPDFYTLRYETLRNLEGFQKLAAERLLEGIELSKNQPFDRVLFSLGIRHIGVVVAQKLAYHYGSIERLAAASYEDLRKIPNIGAQIAHSTVSYFSDPENIQLIDGLKRIGLQFKLTTPLPKQEQEPTLPLTGKTFLLSGTFYNFERDAFKDFIKKHGGNVTTNISQKLNYIVIGKKPGSTKLEKAEKLGISVIDETEVIKMLSS